MKKEVKIDQSKPLKEQLSELFWKYRHSFHRILSHNKKFQYLRDFVMSHTINGTSDHPMIMKVYSILQNDEEFKNINADSQFRCYVTSLLIKNKPLKEQLQIIVERTNNDYGFTIRKKGLVDRIVEATPLLSSDVYNTPTRVFWILNDIHDWDDPLVRCHNPKCNKPLSGMNVYNIVQGYQKYCCPKCRANDPAYQESLTQTINQMYGVDNGMNSKVFRDRLRKTILEKYGCEHALQNKEIYNKTVRSRYANGKFSKSEQQCYYILIDKFGADDIVRQYGDKRYPFHCDFYIKSKDLFIEFNGYWFHGTHPYDPFNESDRNTVTIMMSKDSKIYKDAARNWAIRDLVKRSIADIEQLNYKEFWTVQDLERWVSNV